MYKGEGFVAVVRDINGRVVSQFPTFQLEATAHRVAQWFIKTNSKANANT
jgi:hypothetical protein